jgi:hypothetical protein
MEINENMEEMLERLLATKNWEELSPQERSLVIQELGSEEQYILMRKIGSTLVSEKPDFRVSCGASIVLGYRVCSNGMYRLIRWLYQS